MNEIWKWNKYKEITKVKMKNENKINIKKL